MTLATRGELQLPPGAARGFDHADIDLAAERLYVAHTGANRIDIIDCRTDTYAGSLDDLPGVAGVLIGQDDRLLISSDRGCARSSLWQLPGDVPLGTVAVDAHPNGLAYDPVRRRVFVFCLGDPTGHDPTLVVVDVERLAIVERLALPGRPRWAIHDPASDQVYADIRDPAEIVAIDTETLQIARTIDVPAAGPHGLALDNAQLLCAADGGALVSLDAATGAVLGQVALPGEPDVLWHDPHHQRAYVAIGQPGYVCVVDTAAQRVVQTLDTEPGAHTTAWHPTLRRLYVFAPQRSRALIYHEEEQA